MIRQDRLITVMPDTTRFEPKQKESIFAEKGHDFFWLCNFKRVSANPVHDVTPGRHAPFILALRSRSVEWPALHKILECCRPPLPHESRP